jgi:uncharacterized protein YaaW (UPF0174 family)
MNEKKLALQVAEKTSLKRVSATTGVMLGLSALVGTVLWLIFVIGRR